jgi:hypothetical protein
MAIIKLKIASEYAANKKGKRNLKTGSAHGPIFNAPK